MSYYIQTCLKGDGIGYEVVAIGRRGNIAESHGTYTDLEQAERTLEKQKDNPKRKHEH